MAICSNSTKRNSYFCFELEAPFLLNNSYTPPNNISLTKLYNQRKQYGAGAHEAGNVVYTREKMLVWDAGFGNWHRNREKYWKLDNIDDLIAQFNYVGYHDVCNYPSAGANLLEHFWEDETEKGFILYVHGYRERNHTGIQKSDIA